MKKIFITRRIPIIAKELLKERFIVHENDENKALSKEKIKEIVKEYDGIISTVLDKFTPELLIGAKTRVISNYAVGLDNIDLNCARENGIAVYNTPDVVTNSTADMTFALLLSLIRKIYDSNNYVNDGSWIGWDPEIFLGEELDGKTFGIIGLGKIGEAVARRATGFGLKVIFYNRTKKDKYEQVELDYLFQESDYISIHVPLNAETRNLINSDTIKKMKRKPILLNLSRGPVVDTETLLSALKDGQIRGACLDVTDPEPISSKHPLCHMRNCIITPHIGTATKECRHKMAELAANNIINHFDKLAVK